jgi:hypothetical protein
MHQLVSQSVAPLFADSRPGSTAPSRRASGEGIGPVVLLPLPGVTDTTCDLQPSDQHTGPACPGEGATPSGSFKFPQLMVSNVVESNNGASSPPALPPPLMQQPSSPPGTGSSPPTHAPAPGASTSPQVKGRSQGVGVPQGIPRLRLMRDEAPHSPPATHSLLEIKPSGSAQGSPVVPRPSHPINQSLEPESPRWLPARGLPKLTVQTTPVRESPTGHMLHPLSPRSSNDSDR